MVYLSQKSLDALEGKANEVMRLIFGDGAEDKVIEFMLEAIDKEIYKCI